MEIIKKLLSFSLSFVLILSVVKCFDYNENELETEEGLQAMYNRWREHHKVTEKSPERFNVFKANVQLVHNHNKMNKPYKLSINKFSDMTNEEFRSSFVGEKKIVRATLKSADPAARSADLKDLPKRVDWREHNAVTCVKKRGNCGSTFLFSTVGAIEGINAIKTGQLVTLSEQHFLDCFIPGGHTIADIYKFSEENGVATNESYPYVGFKGTCDQSKIGRYKVTIDGFESVPPNSESELMKAVAQQPVVFLTYPGPDFPAYKGGIYGGPCGPEVEALLLVGYDETSDGTKYWIAKNLWGEEWGEKGYVRLQRGLLQPEGYCHMYGQCTFPTKSIETRNIEL